MKSSKSEIRRPKEVRGAKAEHLGRCSLKAVYLRNVCGLIPTLLLAASPQAAEPYVSNAADREKIEQAIPHQAWAKPLKPRRLLIFTLNVNYGGHPSIAYASQAFTRMGQETGAFTTEVSNDPAVFEKQSLSRFDAVFFNNNVGNCFTNRELRKNLAEFVASGHGLLGVHGTTVAFTQWPGAIEDWPEFGLIIGARGANHKASTEHVWMKLDDPQNPVNAAFKGEAFDFRDEFFRPQGTYSRNRLRVLLSIDTSKTDVNAGQPLGNTYRADNDCAVAWIHNYGRGRVFYCTIAHNPYVFWDPTMLQFYLAAVQFALGDLPAPTTPSARLSPALLAEEKLNWRPCFEGTASRTLFDSIETASRIGFSYIAASSDQPLSDTDSRRFDAGLSDDDLAAVRMKLAENGVRLIGYKVSQPQRSEAGLRDVFEFGRKVGLEMIVIPAQGQDLDSLEKLATEYDIQVALHDPADPEARKVLKTSAKGRALIGIAGNTGDWLKAGANPTKAMSNAGERLLALTLQDVDKRGRSGKQVPLGSGVLNLEKFLGELAGRRLHPTTINFVEGEQATEALKQFNAAVLRLSE